MISFIRGDVVKVAAGLAVIDVNGVGMRVYATDGALRRLEVGRQAQLDTVLIVKEDSHTLYGFADEAQREVFELLITVSGIGPRIALAILNTHEVAVIEKAVAQGEDRIFSQVSGIGLKGAKKIVLELSGKFTVNSVDGSHPSSPAQTPVWEAIVREALVGLGWSDKEAQRSVTDFKIQEPEITAAGDSAQILRNILREVGRQKAQTS